ncbi:MAG: hypothetical protein QOE86_1251 [Solirubrobacteraceae bacterium]|jgi:hypothetical protein|nr:hypothetical protein [Solirubrobacteraceae bacterium]
MPAAQPKRVLVVANRTASTPALLHQLEQLAPSGAAFTLIIPPEVHPEHTDWTQAEAVALCERAAGRPVATLGCGDDAAATIGRVVESGNFDALILSTQTPHHARWHHHDLPHRLEQLGLPVTIIPPEPGWGAVEGFPSEWTRPQVSALT